jgi:hypothetical protein
MAVSPTRPGPGPMKQPDGVMSGTAGRTRAARADDGRKVEQQQVRSSRRAEEDAAAERARQRRAEETRGRNVDVEA